MKCLILMALLSSGSLAIAGTYLEKGMYIETDIVIGFGKTKLNAEKDALAAIPTGFAVAKNSNSPAVQCTNNKTWNEKNQCAEGKVRLTLPIHKI